ncbi:FecR domain-containing protein [Aliifodinibius sp. S!AR15-10]|uniref:FecR family protein n=1 Tax=Aliifodinibius sp. S!AR15-10 TaxID=2950437 RepID=UPI002854FAEA|nr:FecR domain-containing protein [Aliifodinibius sp. S!AR15-10]MDR8394530.1 FecR domain-containing protein [Aliifodinibius sp. S!AR15-10]
MNKKVPWNKLGKYLSGNCSRKEREDVERWIDAEQAHQDLVSELREIWKDASTDNEWNVDLGWRELSKKLDKSHRSPLRLVKSTLDEHRRIDKKKRARKWSVGVRVAASIAILAVFLLSIVFYQQEPVKNQQEVSLVMQEVVTEKGQRSQFKLNDGTQVWLNGDSQLKIPSHFTTDVREVHLKGEAYFVVEPNPDKPFIIHAGESLTRVLGTQFNLQAYPQEDVQIVVEEGKVAFGKSNEKQKNVELVKNQMGILAGDKANISSVEDIKMYTGWTQGQLMFKDTPLKRAATRLERWFDVEIILADPALETRTITGTFKEESMTEILKIIALSVGMNYKKEKNTITFYPK